MLTFLCKRCGALKRRQIAIQAPLRCDCETILLRKAHLEAATKWAQRARDVGASRDACLSTAWTPVVARAHAW